VAFSITTYFVKVGFEEEVDMSLWFFLVPLIGLLATVARLWTIVHASSTDHTPASRMNENSFQTQEAAQEQIRLLQLQLNEVNLHVLAMREMLAEVAQQSASAGKASESRLEKV
jgi:hypothetical protein